VEHNEKEQMLSIPLRLRKVGRGQTIKNFINLAKGLNLIL
jgi:hypothetical protein